MSWASWWMCIPRPRRAVQSWVSVFIGGGSWVLGVDTGVATTVTGLGGCDFPRSEFERAPCLHRPFVSTRGTQLVWRGLEGGSRVSRPAWVRSSDDSAGVVLTFGLGVSTNSACGTLSARTEALCLASRLVTCTSPNSVSLSTGPYMVAETFIPFCKLASRSSYDSTSVSEMVFIVSEACELGFQSTGQSTPCLATA